MKYELLLRGRAKADIRRAAKWYERQREGLGRDFVAEVDAALGLINYPLRPDNTKLPYGVAPHGLVADKNGYIWYTGQRDGHVGKLDPKTGVVTKYKIPNPSAGGPHTPILRTYSIRSIHGTRPMTDTRRASGTRIPERIFTVVDLPAPFGPM